MRSRKMEDILTEVRGLAKAGYKEVVLTGIHISSYGIDFDEEGEERGDYLGRSRVLDLVEAIQRVEGIQRIRLGDGETLPPFPSFFAKRLQQRFKADE